MEKRHRVFIAINLPEMKLYKVWIYLTKFIKFGKMR